MAVIIRGDAPAAPDARFLFLFFTTSLQTRCFFKGGVSLSHTRGARKKTGEARGGVLSLGARCEAGETSDVHRVRGRCIKQQIRTNS